MKKSDDKLWIGLIAGIVATIWNELATLATLPLHFKHNYWDYGSSLVFRHKPKNWKEFAIAILVQIFFSVQLSIIYAYYENKFPTKHYLIKGVIFGGTIWFLIQGILFLFDIKDPTHKPPEAISEFLIAIIFGVITAWMVNKKKLKRNEE
jgi:uncharacterized membrane protein YagU involved in acid resistance